MAQRDTLDFLAAFAVGALLGAGAVILLRPEAPSRANRILRDLEPYRKQMSRSAGRARKGLGEGIGATAEWSGALGGASRTLLLDVREELADMVAAAREELAQSVDDQVKRAQRALRHGARRLR